MSHPCVRLRPICLAIAAVCILIFLVGPLAIAITVLIYARAEVSITVALGAMVFVAAIGYAMSSSLQWVELGDGIIRGRRLLTRKIVTQRVSDIVTVQRLNSNALGPLENALMNFLLDTTNRGYQLHFRDGSRIPLIRADMSGLDPFLEALAEQLRQPESVKTAEPDE